MLFLRKINNYFNPFQRVLCDRAKSKPVQMRLTPIFIVYLLHIVIEWKIVSSARMPHLPIYTCYKIVNFPTERQWLSMLSTDTPTSTINKT